jgi:hypothetical protein
MKNFRASISPNRLIGRRFEVLAIPPQKAYGCSMATVSDELKVELPADICAELGIGPGVQLQFRAREGKLEAVKISTLAEIYTPERNAEELTIQKGTSCEVPEDFPR